GKLLPGATETATATYVVKQSDVDRGSIANTATANGTTPTNTAVTPATASATVTTVAAAPAISATKTAAYTPGSGAVGSVIPDSLSAKNIGNVTLTGVAITDQLAGLGQIAYTWPGTSGVLAPSQTVTATATYTLTQADVDRGSVVNRATASGTSPAGTTVSGQSPQVTTNTADAAPALSLTKSGSAAGTTAGSTVGYTFTLRNTGNVTLTGVGITDPLLGAGTIAIASWPSGTAGRLNVGDTVTGTATYTLTQSDVDAGSVANTATATATPPTGAAVSTTASATVPVAATGALAVTKSGAYTSGSGAVGSVIRWTIGIRNSGNVTLSGIAATDTLAGLGTLAYSWPGTAGTLAPGQTATAVADYTVTQADVDAGAVRNTATATGRTPQNATVARTSPQANVSTAAAAPALSLAKAGTVLGGAAGNAGDVLQYTFTLRNTGNVTVTGASVTDPLGGLSTLTYAWPGTAGTLAPGQTATATARYTITQADVNSGSVRNTATAAATPPGGGTVSASSGQVTTPTATAAPSIVVTKAGALATGGTGVAGDTVNWSFTLRNAGNVTLTGATITYSMPGIVGPAFGTWSSGTAGTLQPGQTVTATATYVLKQSDVDAGSVANTATGSGTAPAGGVVTSAAPATVSVTAKPSIGITKTPSVTTGAKAGDTITYTFVARNTGNVTLTQVAISDALTGLSTITYSWPGTSGTLTPGQSVSATASYDVRQADVDAASLKNTAGATGKPPTGAAVTASSGQVTVTTVAAGPAITATKTARYTTGSGAVGSVLTYSFSAQNTGNVTLTGVTISDQLTGLSALSYSWPGASGALAPRQTVTATATYTLTQADLDRGSVVNRATASGTSPGGVTVSGLSPEVTTNTAPQVGGTTFSKSGTASGTTAGSTITYTFTVQNIGNITLRNVTITDPLPGLSPIVVATWPSGTAGQLDPGDQVTATATYTVTQADVDAGAVSNTATVSGTRPSGATGSRTASATVPIASGGALALTKSSAYQSGSGAVGSVIRYTFGLRNTGNVTLAGVAVVDPLPGLSGVTYTWPGTAGTLAPNQTATGTATYTVTQADVDRGSLTNTATAAGRSPGGTLVTSPSASATTPTTTAAPAILTLKSATVSGNGGVGDRISYTITAQNIGNVTLTGVTVSDPMFTTAQIRYGAWPSGTVGTLRPGDVVTATAVRVITQADVDAGNVINTSSSSGTSPGGATVTDPSDQVTTATATRAPQISLTQTGALPTGSAGVAGDTVTWSFTITNTGNTTLTQVKVTPGLAGATPPIYGSWPVTAGTLAPGQSVTATATSQLTQAQVDAGSVTDPAVASGLASDGTTTVTAAKPATVSYSPASTLTLSKSGGITSGTGGVGSVVTYSFTATNTGATTLSRVAIDDPHAGLSPLSYSWPNAPNAQNQVDYLLPGQQVTATATYAITQADVDRGSTTNTATASATSPQGGTVNATSNQVTVGTGTQPPGLSLSKSAAYLSGSGAVGSVLRYTFTATNTGSLTLSGVSVVDPLPALGPITPSSLGTLTPGQSASASADYTVSQADVDRGYVQNTASASATYNGGASTIGAQSNTLRTTTVAAAPALSLTKTGSVPAGTTSVGTTASFSFVVRNTGNVTLSGVGITDQLAGVSPIVFGAFPGPSGVLAPGESVTATASYAVTQADIDAGSVINTATANGTSPTGGAVSTPGSATVPLTTRSELTATKSAQLNGTGVAGDTISYTFVVRNSGTTTLRGVVARDALPAIGLITFTTWPSGTTGQLNAGQQVTGTASYTITQADVDAGSVVNQVTARATRPDGGAVTPALSNQVTTPLAPAVPRLQVTKTPSVTSAAKAGDVIRYAVTVANTGNVTVSGISVTDGLPAVTDLAVAWPGQTGVLVPGQSAPGTASYAVTQADVDAGSVQTTVTATGTGARGGTASSTGAGTTTTQPAAPAITVTDAGQLASGSAGRAGDTAQFSYVLTNSGNVTLTDVTASEALTGGTAPVYGTWPGGVANRLAPGQSVAVTTSYALKQTDVDAKQVTSTVTARGTGPAPASTAVSANATAQVPIASTPSLSPVKSGGIVSPGIGQVGDTIRYQLVTTNTGNVTLYQGSLVDPLPGLRITSIDWPDNSDRGTLPPGTSVTGFGDYTITQADVNLGYIRNTAHVAAYTTRTGQDPANLVSADSNTVQISTVQAAPALSIQKSGAPRAGGALGDTIEWTVTVTNTGNVTVSGVQITDSLALQDVTITPGANAALDPGQVATLRGTTRIAQSDVDAGAVTNVAAASGTPARGGTSVTAGPVSATVRTTTQAPAVSVTKSAVLRSGSTGVAGDLVDFSYTVTNSGNTTLTGVALSDGASTQSPVAFGTWPGPTGTLLPGQSVTATAQHRLTQAEVDAGGQSSAVTATAVPPASTGVAQVSATASAGVTVTARPDMAVTKTGTVVGSGGVGDTIAYRFSITNTGNVTLSLVDLVDALQGVTMPVITWPGQTGILAPGERATATAGYTITQADVDRGSVGNTATASGKPPVGDTIFRSSPLNTTTVAPAAPAISVRKSASPTSGLRLGDTVNYTVTATNSGNVTLTGITASDALPGVGPLTPTWPGPAGQLAPAQVVTYTASYRVTQADVDAGSVTNIATVGGTGTRGGSPSGTASTTSTIAVAGPSIRVTDGGALEPGSTGSPNDVVTWSYIVTNTGDVTLRTVTLSESQTGASAPAFASGFTGTLAPGQSVIATATYRLTQPDIDAGSVSSSVSTSGLPPTGAAVTSSATATVTIPRSATYTVVKRAELIDGPPGQVGQRIRYYLDVQNTGNVTLYRGTLLDPLPGLGTQFPSWPDPQKPGQLAPGNGATGYADYPIRQADVDRGYLDNVATVAFFTTATGNGTDNRVDVPSNPVRVTLAQAQPLLSITKKGVPSEGVQVGDRITWTIDVRNIGNVTVKAVQITDDDPLTITSGTTTPGDLAPGQTATLVGTSPITQTELDAGRATNTARSSGTSARDNAPVASGDITAVVTTVAAANAIDLVKTAAQGSGWSNRAGDTVVFSYSLSNTGNTTLTGVQVQDALPLVGVISYAWPGTAGRLAPGQTATATASYRVTQADVDAGSAGGAATATGAGRGGNTSDTDTASVPITASPDMRVTKVGTARGAGGVGDTIDYRFTITNSGNVTLTLVDLVDQLGGVTDPSIAWPRPASPGVLLPGEQADATATYTVTQADVDRGTVSNTATASGKPPVGDTILRSSNASLTTVAVAAPALSITETANPTSGLTAATTIDYSIRVQNTGNVTVSGLSLTESLPGITGCTVSWPGAPGVLAPGQVATITPSYRVTQADIDAGSVTNVVSAAGSSPAGTPVSASASVTSTAAAPAPAITVSDSGALAGGSTGAPGDTVTFSYVVRNAGNVTLRGVTLQEALTNASTPTVTGAGWPAQAGVLAPGQSATFTSTYVLTQDDIDRGTVASRITAAGISPSATTADASAVNSATVTIPQRRGLSAVKTGVVTTGTGAVGDPVRYTLVVTNTGNVTLYQGSLVDPLPGLVITSVDWPDNSDPGTLPPGGRVTGVGNYALRQADVDRGYIDNTAQVGAFTTRTGTDPADRVSASSNTVRVTTESAQPELTQTLTAVRNGTGAVGDTIDYTIVTTNTGNVAISAVSIAGRPGIPAPTPATGGTLAPGASVTSSTTYRITQADVDAGSVTNLTTASGTSVRDGAAVSTTSNSTVTPTVTRAPAIGITDSGALASATDNRAGGTVNWTYTITNQGNTTITQVAVSDALPNVGAPVYSTGTPITLAPGASVTATATYTLTQADVDAGSVISSPTASGNPPAGAPATASTTATVLVQANPQFAITKTAALQTAGRNGVGDTVVFRFTLSNPGNTTLRQVNLTDTLAGLSIPEITWPTATDGLLPPGSSATGTATYQIAQKDVDTGAVQNQASATAVPPTGPTLTAQSTVASISTAAQAPGMQLTETGGTLRSGTGVAGDVVRFTFGLRNTGNVTLSAISLADTLPGAGTPVVTLPGGGTTLIPGATATAYVDYTLTQADVDRGYVDNAGSATATPPSGTPFSVPSNTFRFTTAQPAPAVTTTQSGALQAGQTGVLGDTVDYVFTVRNTGNVTLRGVTFQSSVGGLTQLAYTWPTGTAGVIPPGQTATLTASHVVTQADVDAGVIRNVETGRGVPPSGAAVQDAAPELVIPLASASTDLTLSKTGVARAGGGLGDTIDYTLTLRNSGTATLTGASIDDGLPGLSPLSYGAWPTGSTGVLPPGTQVTATATYVVTQADVDAGSVVNTATASGTDPQGRRTTAVSPASTVAAASAAAPRIALTKSLRLAPGSTGRVGDLVLYSFDVENAGTVTLQGVAVRDDQPGITAWSYAWPGTPGILAPGQRLRATAQYALTQPDIDAGAISSTGTAEATGARGGAVSDADLVPLAIAAAPTLAVTKTAAAQGTPTVGGTIGYTIRVENTGNVTLTGVAITDPLLPALAPTWPGAAGVLAPGEVATATGSRTVTQADVDAGAVANTATATGTDRAGTAATAQGSATVQVPNGAAITLAASVRIADGQRGYAGDSLVWTYVITNTGSRTLTGVTLADPQPGLGAFAFGPWPGGTIGTLAPGQSVLATASSVITAAQQGSRVVGTATVSAVGASAAQRVDDEASAAIQLPALPADPTAPSRPVPGRSGGLAVTGTDALLPAGAGAVLVLWGLMLVGVAALRRRKENG
ncbi:MAG: DUF11 domain-containing protein, partial [Micrococcales bacterium]|nr:DUF11 domain-containing protein [Micrococcales bacterium]